MPPFDFPNKFSVPFKKRFITLSSSLLMDLLIKVTGYNSKFFFLLKTGLEVQTNAYSPLNGLFEKSVATSILP